jgi:hypothetical protein
MIIGLFLRRKLTKTLNRVILWNRFGLASAVGVCESVKVIHLSITIQRILAFSVIMFWAVLRRLSRLPGWAILFSAVRHAGCHSNWISRVYRTIPTVGLLGDIFLVATLLLWGLLYHGRIDRPVAVDDPLLG